MNRDERDCIEKELYLWKKALKSAASKPASASKDAHWQLYLYRRIEKAEKTLAASRPLLTDSTLCGPEAKNESNDADPANGPT